MIVDAEFFNLNYMRICTVLTELSRGNLVEDQGRLDFVPKIVGEYSSDFLIGKSKAIRERSLETSMYQDNVDLVEGCVGRAVSEMYLSRIQAKIIHVALVKAVDMIEQMSDSWQDLILNGDCMSDQATEF